MYIGQNIKNIRRSQNLTLEQLANRCGLTKGHLSKLERAKRSPAVSTLQALAVALHVDISDFFGNENVQKQRDGDLDIVYQSDGEKQGVPNINTRAGYSYKSLVKNLRGKYMSPFLMTIEKGKTEVFSHDSEEFTFVVKGAIIFKYEDNSYDLKEGDSFYFDSRKPHQMINENTEPAKVLAVNFNYKRF